MPSAASSSPLTPNSDATIAPIRCGVCASSHNVVITAGSATGSSGSIAAAARRSAAMIAPASTGDRTIRCTVAPDNVPACCSYGRYHVSAQVPESRTSSATPTTVSHGFSGRAWRSRLPTAGWPGHKRSARRRLTIATGVPEAPSAGGEVTSLASA